MQFPNQTDGPIEDGFLMKDLSGHGNHGFLKNGAKFVHRKLSRTVTALKLTTGYIEIPHSSSLEITQNLTIEIWVKCTDTASGYAVLKKGSFGYPKFKDDIRHYQERGDTLRTFSIVPRFRSTHLHYHALVSTPHSTHAYLDGKLLRIVTGTNTNLNTGKLA